MISNKGILITTLVIVILLITIASCATVGRKFPVEAINNIQLEETTKEDINKIFGSPWRIGLEDGKRTWTYGYYKYRLFGESTTRDLVIKFDSNGVVSSYIFNTTDIEEEMK